VHQQLKGRQQRFYTSNKVEATTCIANVLDILIVQKTNNKKANVHQQLERRQQKLMHPTY
jgi:hypothetical protein